MINYVWTITSLYTLQHPDPDYVVIANWTCTGTDGEYTASMNGSTQFVANPDQTDFIPYDELTEEIVIGWVTADGSTLISAQECVKGQIESMIKPPVSPTETPLPWNN